MRTLGFAVSAVLLAACVREKPEHSLEIAIDATSIDGTFDHAGVVIAFHAESDGSQHATLRLDVSGVPIDIDLDLERTTLTEDGHGSSLYAPDLAALLALRDTLGDANPELIATLHGSLLLRAVDRLAEAPSGLVLDRHATDFSQKQSQSFAAPGCGDDGVTCLSGTQGSTYAVYDPGSNGTCEWKQTTYGGDLCYGRCGAGCSFWDSDYTWDCLDHDRCLDAYGGSALSGNVNCGDEFWDASDDYAATFAPYCFSGHSRTAPLPTPHRLISAHTGKCLDAGWGATNGTDIVQWTCHTGTDQLWTLTELGDGTVQVVNRYSGNCLDLDAGSVGLNGARIQEWDCWGGDNQRWYAKPVGDGIALVSKASGRCIDIPDWQAADGVRMQQYDCHFWGNQVWRLE